MKMTIKEYFEKSCFSEATLIESWISLVTLDLSTLRLAGDIEYSDMGRGSSIHSVKSTTGIV